MEFPLAIEGIFIIVATMFRSCAPPVMVSFTMLFGIIPISSPLMIPSGLKLCGRHLRHWNRGCSGLR
jgi:hypothetical protein